MGNTLLFAGIGLWLAVSVAGLATLAYWQHCRPETDGEWRFEVESADE